MHGHVYSVILLVFILFVTRTSSEIFSSIDQLEKLADDVKFITQELSLLANEVDDDFLNRKVKLWQDEQSLLEQNVVNYTTNPLNAFLLIKRVTADIKLIAKRFPENSQEFLSKIEKYQPKDDDLTGAVEGLLRLQAIYRLKTDDFADGIIDRKRTRSPLSPHDLFVIGEEASRLPDKDYFAQEYLKLARTKINEGLDSDSEIDKNVLLRSLMSSYNKTGDYSNALKVAKKLVVRNPNNEEFKDLKRSLAKSIKIFGNSKFVLRSPYSDKFVKNGQYDEEKEEILYSQVCRGSVTQSLEDQAQLRCRFVSNNAFSRLARFKIEEAHLDPYIVLFVDVLSDAESELLKDITKPKIYRAGTFSDEQTMERSSIRVAQTFFHEDHEHEIFQRISRRVEDMTGLSQKTAEGLQVQNYGIGGHYFPHWDCAMEWEDPFPVGGNRIATVLFYLSDVEKGGGTVFLFHKLLVPARKGAAAFWFNLKPSGESDFLSRHAGCPVLLGSKWVANKWIHEYDNEFRRPCVAEKFKKSSLKKFLKKFF